MARKDDRNKYLHRSLALHAVVLLLLIVNMGVKTPLPVIKNTNHQDVISAVVLGEASESKLLLKEAASAPEKQAPSEKVPPKLIAVQKPKASLKEEKEEAALKLAAKKAEIEKQKQAERKRKLAKQKAEKRKKLARLKKQMKKQRKSIENELLADLKRVKKTKQKKKTLASKKLKFRFKETLHQQTEKSLRQELLDEEIKLQSMEARESQGQINKYKALILQAISQNWVVPVHANKKLFCELMIRVAPGGMVMDVKVIKTSGDRSLDSSARAAVLKASPLPVPGKDKEFEAFRQFVLKVKPENVLVQ